MNKWKIFMVGLMILALLAIPVAGCGEEVQYTLTMAVSPEGGGTITPTVGTHDYDEDTEVTITATAESGYKFDSWTGDVADTSATTTTVTMDADQTVTANFTEVFTLDSKVGDIMEATGGEALLRQVLGNPFVDGLIANEAMAYSMSMNVMILAANGANPGVVTDEMIDALEAGLADL